MNNLYKKTKEKFVKCINKLRTFLVTYMKTNILFISYVFVCLFNSTILRYYTTDAFWNIKPVLADLAIIVLIGSVGYFIRPKKRFTYYSIWAVILTAICFINSVYYNNYVSFASFSLLATTTQAVGVANAITKIFELKDLIYLVPLILFFVINGILKKKKYFHFVEEIEFGKVRAMNTAIAGLVILGFFVSMLTGTDLSRLKKQWNREYVVMQFGIYVYQFNDLISSLKPQISPLFGIDSATKEYREYYANNSNQDATNDYTNIYEGKNVLVIHAESIQNWLLGYKINGQEITPNLNKLSKEGLYFNNFYAQESVGTSSDTEFTFNTSLLPASSGTVFVSYWDRDYSYSTQNLLKQKGYYTFSMHGNNCTMWNRNNMYPSLGYDKFYCYKDAYNIDDVIGIGLSDKSFFRQSTDIIADISKKHTNYYGTLIMLSNHTPWDDIKDHSTFDVTMPYTDPETGEQKVANYLEGTTMGDYIKSANYADAALGEFMNSLEEKGLLDNTVIVIYGDHDSKLKKSEYTKLYNYNPVTNGLISKDDENYVNVDYYYYELNRKVPFIIWTKDNRINKQVDKVMGMSDVQPTLGNMFNFFNPYALGKDIFSVDENMVIFPDGNWLTNKMYYNSQKEEGFLIQQNDTVSVDYIEKNTKTAEEKVSVSDKIIVYDLFNKMKNVKINPNE
ncbi:MAG TPA: LTA synthase family protein [Bacilli bacterium]|nr:LTA synthase family protein [Bacilli bacterium]